jgi:hypothetical protein
VLFYCLEKFTILIFFDALLNGNYLAPPP